MAYRRGMMRRRRRPSLRWFTPNMWMASQVNTMNPSETVSSSPEWYSESNMVNLLRGSAPFPGVTNSAGLLAGTMLAERQFYRILRIVGRMQFFFRPDNEVNFTNGGVVSVHWAVVRWHTEDSGIPDTEFLDLVDRSDQDEKPVIIAQDVWRTVYPAGTSLAANAWHSLAAEPPMYTMIDIRTKRPFRNEQDLFLLTKWGMGSTSLQTGTIVELGGLLNLRVLGSFGR